MTIFRCEERISVFRSVLLSVILLLSQSAYAQIGDWGALPQKQVLLFEGTVDSQSASAFLSSMSDASDKIIGLKIMIDDLEAEQRRGSYTVAPDGTTISISSGSPGTEVIIEGFRKWMVETS